MRTLRQLQTEVFSTLLPWRPLGGVHWLHTPPARTKNGKVRQARVSLFDELFPEEKEQLQTKSSKPDIQIPRLPLSDIDHLDPFVHRGRSPKGHANKLAEAAAQSAVKQWNPAVLVLQRASKSLVDADFRRVAPKGRHIEEWTGPGDILKGTDTISPQSLRGMF